MSVYESTFQPGNVNVSIWPMRGDDPIHRRELLRFLKQEATTFGTQIQENGFAKLVDTIMSSRVQVLFVLVKDEIAGCAVQFPTVCPKWDARTEKFSFLPAVYSEDMVVSQDASSPFRERFKTGLGTVFMQGRIRLVSDRKAGGNNLSQGIVAGALVGEQAWPEDTAIGKMLGKFNTTMATDKGDAVLRFANNELTARKPSGDSRIEVVKLASRTGNDLKIVDDMFATTWQGRDGEQIVATFTRGMSTFTGEPVVRVQIASNQNLPSNKRLQQVLGDVLVKGRAEVIRNRWIKDSEPTSSFYLHALGDTEGVVRENLRQMGAKDRRIGEHTMHPLRMDFDRIPASIELTLTPARPFVAIPAEQPALANGAKRAPTRPVKENLIPIAANSDSPIGDIALSLK